MIDLYDFFRVLNWLLHQSTQMDPKKLLLKFKLNYIKSVNDLERMELAHNCVSYAFLQDQYVKEFANSRKL